MPTIEEQISIIEAAEYSPARSADERLNLYTVAYYVAGGQTGVVTLLQLREQDARFYGQNPFCFREEGQTKNHWDDGGQLVRQSQRLLNGDAARGHWTVNQSRTDATFRLTPEAIEIARNTLFRLAVQGTNYRRLPSVESSGQSMQY